MADVDIPFTTGSGTAQAIAQIRAFQRGAADYDLYVRPAYGTTKGSLGNIPWTVTTTGLATVIAADVTRVGLVVVSAANGIVYIRFDATIPTPSASPPLYDYLLNPGERWEVPHEFIQLQQSWVGAIGGGVMLAAATLCA